MEETITTLTGEEAIALLKKSKCDFCISAGVGRITTYLDINKKKFLARLRYSTFVEIEIEQDEPDGTIWLKKLTVEYKKS